MRHNRFNQRDDEAQINSAGARKGESEGVQRPHLHWAVSNKHNNSGMLMASANRASGPLRFRSSSGGRGAVAMRERAAPLDGEAAVTGAVARVREAVHVYEKM